MKYPHKPSLSSQIIETPSIESLFSTVLKQRGISLFSAATEREEEYTGFHPLITIRSKEVLIGDDSYRIEDPLAEMDRLLALYDLPDQISLVGYMAYDYKDRLEEGIYDKKSQGIFDDFTFILFEHYLISCRSEEKSTLYTLKFGHNFPPPSTLVFEDLPIKKRDEKETRFKKSSLNREEFKDAVSKTIDYIKAGEIYQANITRSIEGETDFTPLETAIGLYGSNRISYGLLASLEEGVVISTSPELFFETENGKIKASPIKGTIPRSSNPKDDEALKNQLLASEKNKAELAMIVDLLRNDLSRVCSVGSVSVSPFPLLMSLENVYHLYAHVTGDLKKGITMGQILRKTFPGGSITGCPKIRACQIIDKLESCARGIYTGSFGTIGFRGRSRFNIMIRSLIQCDKTIIFNVGGGITILSDPEDEFEETIAKGSNIWKAMNMKEELTSTQVS